MNDLFNPPAVVRPAEDLAALAAVINAQHEAGEAAARRGLEHFRAAGEALAKAKAACGHGRWLAWLKANVRCGERQARRYMALAKSDVTSDLESAWRVISGNAPDEDEDAGTAPPPALRPGHCYTAAVADRLFEVIVPADDPRLLYVAAYFDLDTDAAYVEYPRRGIYRHGLARWLRFHGVWGPWHEEPHDGAAPWYITAPGVPGRASGRR